MYLENPERHVTTDYMPSQGRLYLYATATVVSTEGGDNSREGWVSILSGPYPVAEQRSMVSPLINMAFPLTFPMISTVAQTIGLLGPIETQDGATLVAVQPRRWGNPREEWMYVVHGTAWYYTPGVGYVEEPVRFVDHYETGSAGS